MASRVCLIAMLAVIAGVDRDEHPQHASRRPGQRYTSCATTSGSARARCAAATGSRSRTARGLVASTACGDRAATSRERSTRGEDLLGDIPEAWLVRGAIEAGADNFGVLLVSAVYYPAGKATVSGGFYRVFDNGVRCVRAPCFSYHGVPGERLDPDDGVGCRPRGVGRERGGDPARAVAALATKSGPVRAWQVRHHTDGGRVFRALRLYLRAP